MRRATKTRRLRGLTTIELLIAFAIVAVLVAVAIPQYRSHRERVNQRTAIADMRVLEAKLDAYKTEYDGFPNSLSSVADPAPVDPWGNAYEYLNLHSGLPDVNGKRRKDKNLVPINSDFDLFSKGPDGDSKPALTAPQSHDDIVRANDGSYMGVAEDY